MQSIDSTDGFVFFVLVAAIVILLLIYEGSKSALETAQGMSLGLCFIVIGFTIYELIVRLL